MSVVVVWYRPVLDNLLNQRTGAVGRHLLKKAKVITAAAKTQVGVDTGKLKKSIDTNFERTAVGPQVRIGSDVSYALIHHEGSRPHVIVAKPPKMLTFNGRGGKVIRTKSVNHPGTKPNRYLSDHLKLAID